MMLHINMFFLRGYKYVTPTVRFTEYILEFLAFMGYEIYLRYYCSICRIISFRTRMNMKNTY